MRSFTYDLCAGGNTGDLQLVAAFTEAVAKEFPDVVLSFPNDPLLHCIKDGSPVVIEVSDGNPERDDILKEAAVYELLYTVENGTLIL
jgi:hypothetical protein